VSLREVVRNGCPGFGFWVKGSGGRQKPSPEAEGRREGEQELEQEAKRGRPYM
jgi:hypothetical protein